MENTEVITPDGTVVLEAEVKEPPVSEAPLKPKKSMGSSLKRTENLLGWAYISPMVIGLLLFTVVPLVMSIIGMFYIWDPLGPLFESDPAGFGNFLQIFGKGVNPSLFWKSFGNTLIFAIQLPVGMILGLFLALAMNRDMKGVQVFRVLYYIPCVMSVVAVSIVWERLFGAGGTINTVFGVRLLDSPVGIYFVINVFLIWKGVGYTTLMFIAGLQSVSTDQLEAARIDGANNWTILLKITLPALYPTIFYLFVTGLMGSLQMFNEPFLILGSNGGVGHSGMTVVGFVYYFKNSNIGISSVAAWVLAVFIFIITAIQLYVDGKREAE